MEGEWIEWNGGEIPLTTGARFEAILRNGWIKTGTVRILKTTKWHHKNSSKDIMRYRLRD
jgi:hypothetical protein